MKFLASSCASLGTFLSIFCFIVANSFHIKPYSRIIRLRTNQSPGFRFTKRHPLTTNTARYATLQGEETTIDKQKILHAMGDCIKEANEYADMFGLSPAEAGFYAFFTAVRRTKIPLGHKGQPFVLRHHEIVEAIAQDTTWQGFFTMNDLEKACEDDFLDAARGSRDLSTGWKITDVSTPRGNSFEEARMTFDDVLKALEKGTVIFNAAGAHIPKLAGPSLACTDATVLPCAINMYLTAADRKTSAPPHTDKQDVAVFQTTGRKFWRVFSPPDPSLKPAKDMFARGKGDDAMRLHAMEELGCQILMETILNPGDVLFCPAGFPHTTSTVVDDDTPEKDTSVHLTLGIDHHIWDLDYLSARRLALRRAHVKDTFLRQEGVDDNRYTGKVNQLPYPMFQEIMAELPLGLLGDDHDGISLVDHTVAELERISTKVDPETAGKVDSTVWRETVERLRQQGLELMEIHRNMYLEALQEGERRAAEDAMTAHLETKRVMSPERIQRLSVFRVKRHYEEIDKSKKTLFEWSLSGKHSDTTGESNLLPENWAFTMPVKLGDEVEADLGGAFFQAKVTRASGDTYDVEFFDGDRETNLDRSQIKLLSAPLVENDVDTSRMTSKELKRWRKQQDKLQKKG